jgi:hypothetical protein
VLSLLWLAAEIHSKKRQCVCKGLIISPILALKTLLATPWAKLAEATTKESADTLLETVPGFSTFTDHGLLNKLCIKWDYVCPLCFDLKLSNPPPAIGSRCASLDPEVVRLFIVLQEDCVVLDNVTGEETTKTIHLKVVSCAPLIVSAKAEAFKYWAAEKGSI